MNTIEGYRLSPQQRRVWSLQQEGQSLPYCVQGRVALGGELDLCALEAAVQAVVDQHEILRTTFRHLPEMTVPLQVVDDGALVSLDRRDLSGLPRDQQRARLEALAREQRQMPFDAERGPLIRMLVVALAEREHVLLICVAALCADPAALRNMVREISRAYAAALRNEALESDPLQYADVAEWQNSLFEEDNAAVGRAYWRERDAGMAMISRALPFEREASTGAACAPDALALPISPALRAGIEALGQRYDVQLATVLLACWSCLFWRIAEQQALPIGVARDGRKYEDVADALGPFARYVPIQPALEPHLHVSAVLRQIDEALGQAYAWQEYFTWEGANAASGPGAAFFAIGFDFETQPERERAGGVEFSLREQAAWIDRFNIRLSCTQADGELRATIHYDTQRFAAPDIACLAEAFQTLLESAAAAPELPIELLEIVSDAERRRLLIELNATATSYPDMGGVHQMFAEQARRTPDSIAIWFKEHALSYAELDARANRLAHYLQGLGVGPEVRVALGVERSPELVVALLGILKAGGAYVPLDLSYPAERITFMLADSQAQVLITTDDEQRTTNDARCPEGAQTNDERLRSSFVLRPSSFVNLRVDWPVIARMPCIELNAAVESNNLAYVIYTSGSTGQPKGVMIPHQGLTNYIHWCIAAYPLAEGRGAPVHSPVAFDLTITSLLAPLAAGRGALLLPEDEGIDALRVALQQQGDWSLVKMTPAHLELLSRQLPARQVRGRAKAFIVGGEDLRAESAGFWQAAAPDTLLINEYGPTEAVVGCCVYRVPPGEHTAGSVPIGRPIVNTQLYVLDARLRLVPAGVVGELYIGGVGLARGYLGRPDLTAVTFVPNPFGAMNDEERTMNSPDSWFIVHRSSFGTRLYKTGDLARYLPDGRLVFVGRRDGQVKLRGYRIELGEVEAALRRHPAVRDAAVLLREDAPGQRRLVAYVVPTNDERRTTTDDGRRTMDGRTDTEPSSMVYGLSSLVSELRAFLAERLPAYMLPSAFVELTALPLTPNGKLDRKALPAPESNRKALASAFVAPRTSGEIILAELWERLLRRSPVGVSDNFFALGGDSILGLQIIAAARERGLLLTPKQLFQHQTIAELAAVAGSAAAVEAEQGRLYGAVPLTPIQHLFFEQPLAQPQHYNQALLLRLRQRLAPATLRRALRALLEQHDALRLRYERTEQGWEQRHAEEVLAEVQYVDLRNLAEERQRAALERAAAALQGSLELSRGPLVRLALFELGEGRDPRLLLIVHHLVVDGVSWRVLLEDLYRAATQLAAGQAVQLPPKTTSYQRWAERLLAYARSEEVLAERAYWRALAQQAVPTLPRDYPGGQGRVGSARELAGRLSVQETDALLSQVAAAYHSQINDALLSALVQAVGEWSGQARLLLELEGHGREDLFEDVDLTRTVGWCTSVYPVLLDLRGASDAGAALLAVKEQLRAVPGRGIGYGLLRYLGSDASERAELAVQAQVSFNYLGQVEAGAQASGALFGRAEEHSGPEQHPGERRRQVLEVSAVVEGGQLEVVLRYSPEQHAAATMERLLGGYLAALRGLLAHSAAPDAGGFSPSDFPLAQLDQDDLDAAFEQISFTEE